MPANHSSIKSTAHLYVIIYVINIYLIHVIIPSTLNFVIRQPIEL